MYNQDWNPIFLVTNTACQHVAQKVKVNRRCFIWELGRLPSLSRELLRIRQGLESRGGGVDRRRKPRKDNKRQKKGLGPLKSEQKP